MISYVTYKIIHYVGIFTMISALAAFIAMTASSGTPLVRVPWAKRLVIAHGAGLFLILLGGFGMLARLDITHQLGGLPGWIWAKLALWTVLGVGITLAKRRPEWSGTLLVLTPILAFLAGTAALTKPF
ncbi:MAG: hypothetical protein KJO11_04570 [Gemmatimonadetes bacterium]|nr:hypothetical protein [Gemmatimonadota bacterium]MBT8403707.1 hypothetical protein [Gemmatimonadota bacterium]NNF38305.1 hypothetical protein [Gemmatimonadota bacterium]NNK62295.1 hypothetical protein [Gemmatimonadota bacterium]